MEEFIEELKKYFDETPREKVLADWKETEKYDSVGISAIEFMESLEKNITIKTQLEAELSEDVIIIKVDDNNVDFKTLDGVEYFAKLTKNKTLKKNSIRINRW